MRSVSFDFTLDEFPLITFDGQNGRLNGGAVVFGSVEVEAFFDECGEITHRAYGTVHLDVSDAMGRAAGTRALDKGDTLYRLIVAGLEREEASIDQAAYDASGNERFVPCVVRHESAAAL